MINENTSPAKEKTVEEVKMEAVIKEVSKMLDDAGLAIVPTLRFSERGIVPNIEVVMKPKPVVPESVDPSTATKSSEPENEQPKS